MSAQVSGPAAAAGMATADGWSVWPAPAKLNLFLRIVGRRADGYHDLQTVFRLLDWGDTIRLRVRDDGVIARVGPGLAGVAEADDLAVRAAIVLQRAANVTLGADIIVEKRIPAGGGFGGGSSDAASVLRGLNMLWGCGLDEDALAALGLGLGADVPVFVRGRDAWAEGRGERLTPLALPPAWYLLLDPGVHAATAALFAAPELTRNAAPTTISDFVSDPFRQGPALGNAFAPVLSAREPAVAAALALLAQAAGDAMGRPVPARLTGSGSGCFVEFAERAAAEATLRRLPPGCKAWVVGSQSAQAVQS